MKCMKKPTFATFNTNFFCIISALAQKRYLSLLKINKKSKISAETGINQSRLEKVTFLTERVPYLLPNLMPHALLIPAKSIPTPFLSRSRSRFRIFPYSFPFPNFFLPVSNSDINIFNDSNINLPALRNIMKQNIMYISQKM